VLYLEEYMKIKLTFVIFAFLTVLALSACGPQLTPEPFLPPENLVATQVAVLMTASPPVSVDPVTPVAETPPPSVFTATPQVTSEPTPTQTPPPTETLEPETSPTLLPLVSPTPTATLTAGDPRQELGGATFQDRSFTVDRNWGGPWTGDFTEGRFENNQLLLTSTGPDGWAVTWPRPENFYLEMTAATSQCSGRDRYGLVVRAPEPPDRGYLFGITCDGRYSLRRWDPDAGRYHIMFNWTESPHINAGSNQTNRVGLKVEGGRFAMYVNGHFLGEAFDDTLKEGRFGPYIGHDQTERFTIAISEIAYWELP
jgi:hypothetical protein